MMRDRVESILDRALRVDGVHAALLVDAEAGLPIRERGELPVSGSLIAALSTSLSERISRASAGAGFGEAPLVEISGSAGRFLIGAEADLLLVVLTDTRASEDEVRRAIRGTMEELR